MKDSDMKNHTTTQAKVVEQQKSQAIEYQIYKPAKIMNRKVGVGNGRTQTVDLIQLHSDRAKGFIHFSLFSDDEIGFPSHTPLEDNIIESVSTSITYY